MKLYNADCLTQLKKLKPDSVASLVTDPPAGISFMGKEWDHHKGGRDEWIQWMASVMRECFRVMKPGAHGLVWAIPRTSHWTATALEDAGFEVRDVVTHLFGSGFPKSLDVSKAIDKQAGATREVTKIGKIKSPEDAGKFDSATSALRERRDQAATDSAKQWQGWGTALKPASEHWILIRKPCSEKTVAANVLKHGTGALNIDASRISVDELDPNHRKATGINGGSDSMFGVGNSKRPATLTQGRFPANLIFSEGADVALDIQAGQEVSRFFYCAKISTSERNAGLEDMPDKIANIGDERPSGNMNQRIHGKENRKDVIAKNNHPTVKPKKLMSYLIRMITPLGGTVLDPFMGSGSTGIAAKECGFKFVGIEKEEEYFEIAQKRIG